MVNPDQILRTKLRQPFLRDVLVSRPRLISRLSEGLRVPLTLIAAPAGFGKTTLAASGISDCGMPAAWLSLDENDNQARRFLGHAAASLQQADPRIGAVALELLGASAQVPETAVLASIINDLDASDAMLALVLDDYHVIRSPDVHDLTAYLLEHCPRNLHLVILTRSDPPLPLARLRARGQLVELRAADLRFNAAEAMQFLNGIMDLDLDEGAVMALEEKTEGWISGLQMAALSLRGRADRDSFIEEFSGSSRFVLDYLMDEVLSGQTREIQSFLLCTSILERQTAQLCDFLLRRDDPFLPGARAGTDAASVLAYLDAANLFLISLDDQGRWFRYHHLFADMLQARLMRTAPDLIPRLHRRAAAWLENNEFYGDAVHHLAAAGEYSRAAELIERVGRLRLAENDPSILWLADLLPRATILAHPKLALYQVWMLIVQGQIGRVLPLLHDLSDQFAAARDNTGASWMQTMTSLALAFLVPLEAVHKVSPLPEYALLDDIPDEDLVLRNAADLLYVMALARRGQREQAAQVAAAAVERERERRAGMAVPALVAFLSRIYLMQGKLHQAVALCREYLDPMSARDFRAAYTGGSMMIDLGEVLAEWNLLDEAEQQVRAGLRANELWQNIMTDGFGLAALARILLAKEQFAGAAGVIETFEARLGGPGRPREFAEDLLTLGVRAQLAAGDVQNPALWADQVMLDGSFQQRPDQYRLTLARIRLAQRHFAEVEELLAGTEPPIASGNLVSRQLEVKMLLAAAIRGQGRQDEALDIVASCLETAEPEGYVRTFLDIGEPARELLAVYRQSPANNRQEYARRLLEAFSQADAGRTVTGRQSGLIEPLSERELEVLRHIAQGRTNKEIAGLLFITPGTVKAHTAAIYRKLDVSNRTEAAARGRELGILSEK
ncbi:MAG: LuxR C-terminal-related transcriptional regulator [Candidatus Promineifilaceae bacterium]